MAAEHLHRYLFARELAGGLRVLDVACGEGHGSALLAEVAQRVTALDISKEAVAAAGNAHRRDNLTFIVGDCAAIPLPPHAVDLAVSLGSESRMPPEAMLRELKRVLAPGGVLLISAPGGPASDDFLASLERCFAQVAVAGQRRLLGSALFFERLALGTRSFERDGTVEPPSPSWRLAVAGDGALPTLFNGLLETDEPRRRDAETERLREALATTEAECRQLELALIAQEREANAAIASAEAERQRANAIELSTFWRATRPIRKLLAASPWLRRLGRRVFGFAAATRRRLLSRRAEKARRRDYRPLVSVIVPNFNHARFLPKRLDSILGQTYAEFEVIILDDASTDDSAEVIERYRLAHPGKVRVILNERNSGNVFRQWRRGIEEARGDLLWICESDDFAEPDFLDELVPALADGSVMIGFGRIQFADEAGRPYEGLDAYRERAQRGIWNAGNIRPAKSWFDTALGVSNVIANVGGCLIRNQPVEPAIWEEAATYRVLGDWYLYAMLSRGGQIAYVPGAASYFRQHRANTSVSSFSQAGYYAEHGRLITLLRARWGVPGTTVARFAQNVKAQFAYAKAEATLGPLSSVFDPGKALATRRGTRHILMVVLGFYLGGGEIFPIHLANELVRRGYVVSFLALQSHDWDPRIRAQLDRRIAVYEAGTVRGMGRSRFVEAAGIDLIHSHFVGAEGLFFGEGEDAPDVAYVATLHGSYEVMALTPDFIREVAAHVTHWAYLTQKNLGHLRILAEEERARISSSFIPNGMPLDDRPFDRGREELGIGATDLVFAVVSRAIPEKGWESAIRARALAQARSPRRLVLLLIGSGPEADRLAALHGNAEEVKFMGFQDRVQGLYRLADCALLPSRFQGESFPLTLIQAMQVATPVIATDLGEIARMISGGGRRAGLLVTPHADDGAFAEALAEAMLAMGDDAARDAFRQASAALGRAYGMETVAEAYVDCYEAALSRYRLRGPANAAPAQGVAA